MKSVLIGFLKRQKSPPLPGNVRIGKICRKKNNEIINYEMARANASLSRHKRAKKKNHFYNGIYADNKMFYVRGRTVFTIENNIIFAVRVTRSEINISKERKYTPSQWPRNPIKL